MSFAYRLSHVPFRLEFSWSTSRMHSHGILELVVYAAGLLFLWTAYFVLEGLSCQTVSAGPAGPVFVAISFAQDVFEKRRRWGDLFHYLFLVWNKKYIGFKIIALSMAWNMHPFLLFTVAVMASLSFGLFIFSGVHVIFFCCNHASTQCIDNDFQYNSWFDCLIICSFSEYRNVVGHNARLVFKWVMFLNFY